MGRRQSRRAQARAQAAAAEVSERPALAGPSWLWLAVAAGFAVVSFVLYAPALRGPFVFDDVLLADTYLRGDLSWQLDKIFSWGALRRVPRLTFSLNHALHGMDTYGYHLVNVLVHALNGLLLFQVGRRLLARVFPEETGAGGNAWAALLGALLWLVHPVQVQAVAYVYQRITSLCALFYLASLLAYLEGRVSTGRRRRVLYGLAVLSGIVAVFTKENSATLPVFVALVELMFFDERPFVIDRRKVQWALVLVAVLAVIAASYLTSELAPTIARQDTEAAVGPGLRLLTQARVVCRYVSVLAFPHPSRLGFDEDFVVSRSLLDPPTTLPSVLAVAGALALALHQITRRRLLSFSILWFLGNLAIESTFIPLEHYYEYRLYLPSTIPLVALVAGVARALTVPALRRAAVAAYALALVACGAWTWERSRLWGDDLLLWEDNARKAPNKARVRVNLGNSYAARGQGDKARAEYERAITLNPKGVTAYINLGKMEMEAGHNARARTLAETVLAQDPDNRPARFNLAMVHLHEGRYREAIPLLEGVVEGFPDRWAAYNLILAYLEAGQKERALALARKSLDMWPRDSYLMAVLGRAYLEIGRRAEAEAAFREALAIDPQNGLARMALSRLQQAPAGR
jgi:tetratricopeptide (TPR) repeat protein